MIKQRRLRLPTLSVRLLMLLPYAAFAQDGGTVYERECAACHESPALRAPKIDVLQSYSMDALRAALRTGAMREHANRLADSEVEAVVAFLGNSGDSTSSSDHACDESVPTESVPLWRGWGNGALNTRRQWSQTKGITPSNVERLRLQWAFGFPDAVRARSQPLVTSDTVYVGSQSGRVYALAAANGCEWWHYDADAEVRGAITAAPDWKGGNRTIFFTDFSAQVYSVDADTGQLNWKVPIATHTTATVTGSVAVHGDSLYVPLSSTEVVSAISPDYECCTFRGAVIALDVDTGNVRWRAYTVAEPRAQSENSAGTQMHGPSGAPVWSTPAVDTVRKRVYVGTGQNYSTPASSMSDAVVALSMTDGSIAWSTQMLAGDVWNAGCVTNGINCPKENGPDFDIGASPMLMQIGGRDVLVVGQKSGMVYALDPDRDGELVWSTRVGRGGKKGGVHWGLTANDTTVFAPVGDLPEALETDRMPQPGLHALDAATGEVRWYMQSEPICEGGFQCYPAISAAPSYSAGLVFVGAMNGEIRAVDEETGQTRWSYQTARDFETVNGVAAKGGSIDADGPFVAGGRLFATSGYDIYGQLSGNVLLVFGLEE